MDMLSRPLLGAIQRDTAPLLLIDEIDRADEASASTDQ
jgi:MoxR-like ATPase